VITYLDLCNQFITELGINGGAQFNSIASAVNSLESARIVQFVGDADYEIQSLHHNWKFLWRQYQDTIDANEDTLSTPSFNNINQPPLHGAIASHYQFRSIDRESLVFNYGDTSIASRPRFQPWRQFEMLWQSRGPKQVSNSPPYWSQTPAGNPIVSTVMATDNTPYQFEGWARPQRMMNDGDQSPLVLVTSLNTTGKNQVPPYILPQPSQSSPLTGIFGTHAQVIGSLASKTGTRRESCRIIIVRAKILWAEAEGAIEIMQGSLAEYQDLLEELRADQLPGMEHDRVSQNDVFMTVETE